MSGILIITWAAKRARGCRNVFANCQKIALSALLAVPGFLWTHPPNCQNSSESAHLIPKFTPSAHRFLHELADPSLFSGSQLLQREGGRPQGAFVEVRAVVEAERRVPRLELVRGLEEADDLAVLGIRGHPVPELRREGWRAGFDNRMEPLAEGAIRCLHLADLREHGAFPVRLVRFQFLDALPHRASFLVRKSLDLLLWLLRRLLFAVVFVRLPLVSFLSCSQ